MARIVPLSLLMLSAVGTALPIHAQQVTWRSVGTIYGDNTEFFTPYREGETILGGQLATRLVIRPSPKYAFHVGALGDVRWGSESFLDRVKPILSFRYQSGSSTGVLGTLQTERRHGFIDPLAVSTLELTRPIEYGLQWIERRPWLDGEIFINWQALNTPEQREVFDFGWVFRLKPVRQLALEAQYHGLHHGGQLFSAGVPVTNNGASAYGVTVADTIPAVGLASLSFFRQASRGNIDSEAPEDWPRRGQGTFVRAGVWPARHLEVFGIRWWGRDFVSQEGDNNYNSTAVLPVSFRSKRDYLELGLLHRATLEGGVALDAEFRLHRIDQEPSIAIRGTSWEYSYRLVVRTPFEVRLR
ncbi:MAG: hypothetical protein KF785_03880 [Gemmatimonadales bacterium]|nr:hypothetical protein [Gemmatimonadales bacterium]